MTRPISDIVRPYMLAAVSAACLATTAAGAQTVTSTPITGTRLDVTAEGSVQRIPDLVTVSAGVVTNATTAQQALGDNAASMSRVIAALKKAGIADKDIRTSAINLSPQYRYIENRAPEITGYQASNQVTVLFRDVKKTGGVLDALVANGANQINGPSFDVENSDAAMDEARVAAMKKARARADLYAKAAGLSVKRIVSISESGNAGPVYPMPMMAMARAEKADATPIQAGQQNMAITVNVVFELN